MASRSPQRRTAITSARPSLEAPIREAMRGVRKADVDDLVRRSNHVRDLISRAPLPPLVVAELDGSYRLMSQDYGETATDVAVRSSATAEDLPNASFAGQQESFLNVRGFARLEESVRLAFASVFTPRAISYRLDMGFDHMKVALSVGIQKMVRSDLASAGVIFTLDPDTGHRGVVLVTSSWGLGESVVQGRVVPDQFVVHKATFEMGFRSLVWKKLGTKEIAARLRRDRARSSRRPFRYRRTIVRAWSLSDDDTLELARWALRIERHYSRAAGSGHPDGHRVGQGRPERRALRGAGAPRDRAQPESGAQAPPLRDPREGDAARRGPRDRRRRRDGAGTRHPGPAAISASSGRRDPRHRGDRSRTGSR